MSKLLIVPEPRVGARRDTPLRRSLDRQTDGAWTLDATDSGVTATLLVDDDSQLRPDAIGVVRRTLDAHPDVDGLMGDAIVGGVRTLRPAWSPTRLRSTADELDLVVVRGSHEDASLAGRIVALASLDDTTIGHVPAALLEREAPVPLDDLARAALERMAADRRSLAAPGAVTFLIPTAATSHADGRSMVLGAIEAARHARGTATTDRADEIVLIIGDEFAGDPERLAGPGVRIVHRGCPWNFAAAMNVGLLAASNDAVVLLNDDIEMVESGWLTPMLEHLRDPQVGLVGASLTFPDGTLQHHGMVVDDAFPLHPYVGRRPGDLPDAARVAHEVAVVTGACIAGRRTDLLGIGGFWEALPASFNDADLCFKSHRAGRRVILEPAARLVHFESASRVPSIEPWEWDTFIGRWGGIEDPWYHPGHHRPDDPDDRRRNADHLPADDPFGGWPMRTTAILPRPHLARLQPRVDAAGES